MEFKKFSSIENSYRTKFINKIIEQGKNRGEFVVTEKVHGSNLSVWYDGKEMKFAKRTQFLGIEDSFMGLNTIKTQIEKFTKDLFEYLQDRKNVTEITVFGEIAGGLYESKDELVRELRNVHSKKVQKGVSYHPANIFYIFDVKIDGHYISYSDMMNAIAGFISKTYTPNITWSKPLFKGTFDECLYFPNEYESKIYAGFGLPKLENNICEGNVIKSWDRVDYMGDTRVIIKNKNDKFKEKETRTKPKKVKQVILLNPEQDLLLGEILELVNSNRLRNVLSKIGEVSDKDFSKIAGLFVKDVIDDWKKDNILDDNFNAISKIMGNECRKIVKDNFLNIIDNNF